MSTLETAFAIGRSGNGKTTHTCSRCKGTGWWSLGRKCFKCGGAGRSEVVTLATKIRDKAAHVAEVEEMLAGEVAQIATARFGKKMREERVAGYQAQLVALRAELAALEALS